MTKKLQFLHQIYMHEFKTCIFILYIFIFCAMQVLHKLLFIQNILQIIPERKSIYEILQNQFTL